MLGLFMVHDSIVTPIHTSKNRLTAFFEVNWLAFDLGAAAVGIAGAGLFPARAGAGPGHRHPLGGRSG